MHKHTYKRNHIHTQTRRKGPIWSAARAVGLQRVYTMITDTRPRGTYEPHNDKVDIYRPRTSLSAAQQPQRKKLGPHIVYEAHYSLCCVITVFSRSKW